MNSKTQATQNRAMENLEYLGTVLHGGEQYIALLPLEGDSGGMCFFTCGADGTYGRISDLEVVKALGEKFRPEPLYEGKRAA